ncbi:hypothetical protein AB1Y20_004437 [Prymnesium parvum]|uniref:Uncharacterized protein n=1 Tax=Prymnesium parvum TaxID=97485 RepID=A0AB34IWB6_PRYPA
MSLSPGSGAVPAMPSLLAAARKELEELPTIGLVGGASRLASRLAFTCEGLQPPQLRQFLSEALSASRKQEPLIESGNKYSVAAEFHRLNRELLMHELLASPAHLALQEEDRPRAEALLSLVLLNDELRNRNPLHPSALDAAVIGSLMNFPKHIFGFPFGSYATDGNESLSLVLFAYRRRQPSPPPSPLVLFVAAADDDPPPPEWAACAERVGLRFLVAADSDLRAARPAAAAVMVAIDSPALPAVCAWAEAHALPVHLHLTDAQWRRVFSAHAAPVHFTLPPAVRSVSIEHGLLHCGYQLYRDLELRDAHFDVGYEWQTAYLSPNEGGSGASTPLYVDFCRVLMGWRALGDMARRPAGRRPPPRLAPTLVPPAEDPRKPEADVGLPQGMASFDQIQTWAKHMLDSAANEEGREELERLLVRYQRCFLGGAERELEALTTGGGTRSINLALEAAMKRARSHGVQGKLKVLTGNPHLAVERAERRFGFEVVRLARDGVLVPSLLAEHLRDPAVIAVYCQSLSYTDGTSDDLSAICALLHEENERRGAELPPVVLINDSCLAFCVLVHQRSMRALDLTQSLNVPTVVMLDAHKHLGTDKGVSTVVGSPGTLSYLRGHVKVGCQPGAGELVRGLADMLLVGVDGYNAKYRTLAAEVARAVETIEAAGMRLVHSSHRVAGSTVIAIEDPSGVMMRKLKKLGHSFAYLFNLAPDQPHRCQTGFSLSLTLHCLREVQPGKTALDVFVSDLLRTHGALAAARPRQLHLRYFRENTLLGTLLSGGLIDPYLFSLARQPGVGRYIAETIVRRMFSSLLDSGVVCSNRHAAPLKELLQRATLGVGVVGVAITLVIVRARRASMRRLLTAN